MHKSNSNTLNSGAGFRVSKLHLDILCPKTRTASAPPLPPLYNSYN